nr:MAG TPA: hypothetical protein [Caudoviricetes sp.]
MLLYRTWAFALGLLFPYSSKRLIPHATSLALIEHTSVFKFVIAVAKIPYAYLLSFLF